MISAEQETEFDSRTGGRHFDSPSSFIPFFNKKEDFFSFLSSRRREKNGEYFDRLFTFDVIREKRGSGIGRYTPRDLWEGKKKKWKEDQEFVLDPILARLVSKLLFETH